MGRLKATVEHVWAQPVKVRVAVIILMTFILAIGVLILASAIADLGVVGTLVGLGVIVFVVTLMWSLITVASSDL